MNGDALRIRNRPAPASPGRDGRIPRPRMPITRFGGGEASRVRQVVEAVGRCISFDAIELPEEFFPAHLPVAIVEAVFRFQPGREEQSSRVAKRYCRCFELEHTRRDKFALPAPDEQETVADLIGHYDERGVERMASEVLATSSRSSGTAAVGAQTVLHIASALRNIGVDVLQDVQDRPARALEVAVRSVPGTNETMARLLLTYAGDDDFVLGDDHVRRFVAEATGQRSVPTSLAVRLVCQAAYELIVSPRHLDYRIYRYRADR